MSLDETLDKSAPLAAEETASADPSTIEPSTEQVQFLVKDPPRSENMSIFLKIFYDFWEV